MQKLLFFILGVSLYLNCLSQSSPYPGRLKVTIESIKCITKSWDGVIEFDGHGNEISATYSYRIYNPQNIAAARSGMDGTVIYGSNVNGMTRTGTQTPDLGGIKEGDVIPVGKEIMNEVIAVDDYIIIAPTLWEMDGPRNTAFDNFNTQLENDLNWAITQPYPFATTPIDNLNLYGSRVIKIFDKYPYGQATKYHNLFSSFLCPLVGQGNKPVDARSGTFNNQCMVIYPPTLLVLDARVLTYVSINNQIAQDINRRDRPMQISPYLDINFIENTYAVQTSNGKYSMKLKIEFTPIVNVPPSKTKILPPKIPILKQDSVARVIKQ
jgi:hypothetical protein